jgi:hypothetical protein
MAVCAVTLILLCGCGDKAAETRAAELQSRVDDLTKRVKTLEDQQLTADKKDIQHEQVVRTLNGRLRDMETYIGKLQYGQASAVR